MEGLLTVAWESLLPQLEMEPGNKPCIGNEESYPLDHQEKPYSSSFKRQLLNIKYLQYSISILSDFIWPLLGVNPPFILLFSISSVCIR